MSGQRRLRVGYVPEHFSTPLHFAKKHYGLDADLIPFPSGTGYMITSLRSDDIDVGIGLTEAWIAGLGRKPGEDKSEGMYKLIGTYVETPLCWAISTGARRAEVKGTESLKGGKCGVSRIGSGSYVMAYVLANQYGWLDTSVNPPKDPFTFVPLQTFDKLRNGVNDSTVDFFMWEHFTSKRYYDNGEIRRVGEIYTPWSSWKIAAREALTSSSRTLSEKAQGLDPSLEDFMGKLNQGVQHFEENQNEAVEYIAENLDYSEEDARAWLKTVKFAKDVRGVEEKVVKSTVETLRKAGVLAGTPGDDLASEELRDMATSFR